MVRPGVGTSIRASRERDGLLPDIQFIGRRQPFLRVDARGLVVPGAGHSAFLSSLHALLSCGEIDLAAPPASHQSGMAAARQQYMSPFRVVQARRMRPMTMYPVLRAYPANDL